jgi:hypothetical protein
VLIDFVPVAHHGCLQELQLQLMMGGEIKLIAIKKKKKAHCVDYHYYQL